MQALSSINIESELSYAYLHAVASKAGMSVVASNRHQDNNGIDAMITAWGPFINGGYLKEITINVQLKAQITVPVDNGTHLSYFVRGVGRYNDLRTDTVAVPRILVVLFLPADELDWLHHSDAELVVRRCAYWESLRGAPPTGNGMGATVKLPKAQMFTPQGLTDLAARFSRREFPLYSAL